MQCNEENEKYKLKEIPSNLVLQIGVNASCNCKCKFCSQGNLDKIPLSEREIDENILYKYLLPLYKKTSIIVPTQGEITCSKVGFRWLQWVNDNYYPINIFIETNGISFTEKWQNFAMKNLLNVHFSLNAKDDLTFNNTVCYYKNNPNIFSSKIVKNLDNYISILKAKNLFPYFCPSVSYVINDTNYEYISDFINFAIKRNIYKIGFLFDTGCRHMYEIGGINKSANYHRFIKCLKTIITYEKLLKDKIKISYELFNPCKELLHMRQNEDAACVSELSECVNYDVQKLQNLNNIIMCKNEIRKKSGKFVLSLQEELDGITFHIDKSDGVDCCFNPWKHIRIICNGEYNVCTWRGYSKDNNINNFIKNDIVNWLEFFNSDIYVSLRKQFLSKCYSGCLPQCPSIPKTK